jgi:ATP-binding cassette subfamily B protein
MMDTAVIPGLLLQGVIPSIQALALVIAISVAIVVLSWQLALFALAVGPLLLLISWPFGRSLRRQWHEIKELDTSLLTRLQEVFSAVRLVKTYGKERREQDQLLALAERGLWAKVRVNVTQGKFNAINALFTAVATAGFLIFGARMVKQGSLALGDLVMISALLMQFYSPLQLLVGQVASLQSALASAERALKLLDQAPEVIERPDARSLERARGAVAFNHVDFGYEAGQRVLEDVSFAVEPGARVGIAGHTGAGKTTLMNLLTRLYDPTGGAIRLDRIDLRDLKVDNLRQQFAVVLQEPVLFRKSVAENINYAVPGATLEQTMEAARLANAHDFIMAMPAGYDTIVGERGQRLSGGERQRISLARAFLKDAPVLILDEPTSSVDMRTESTIMEAIQRLMEGRTTFIIAHRPSTLEICDKVLVLDGGKVVAFAAPDSVRSLSELMTARAVAEPPAV